MQKKWSNGKIEWNEKAQAASDKTKQELLCEAPVQLMPTEKIMYFLDIDATVVNTSGILHQK